MIVLVIVLVPATVLAAGPGHPGGLGDGGL